MRTKILARQHASAVPLYFLCQITGGTRAAESAANYLARHDTHDSAGRSWAETKQPHSLDSTEKPPEKTGLIGSGTKWYEIFRILEQTRPQIALFKEDVYPTTMAASGGSSHGCTWPDLQPEMLGVVLSRLPSHADRVRLAAVCRPWRSSARLLRPLPPLLPLLALCDGTFLSLPDGAVHHLPVADDVSSRVSTGSALFLVHGDNKCCLMNPSPVTTSPVPEAADWFRENPTVRKVLMSDHLVAVLLESKKLNINSSTTRKVIISARGQPWDTTRCSTTEWAEPEDSFVRDIALFKGKLYVLLTTEVEEHELRILDDGHEQTTIHGTRIHGHELFNPYATDMYVQRNYLVVSGDRLLMVERRISQPPMFPIYSGIEKRTRFFKVFEAMDLSSGCGLWTEVDTLMGRALFVSKDCLQSLPARGQSSGVGAREDCIYFVNEDHTDTDISDSEEEICENPFLDSSVYNMGDQTVTPLPLPSESVEAPTAGDGPWSPTWLFPET